jgi:hypothetical protein
MAGKYAPLKDNKQAGEEGEQGEEVFGVRGRDKHRTPILVTFFLFPEL